METRAIFAFGLVELLAAVGWMAVGLALALARRKLQATTLMGAWCWAVVAWALAGAAGGMHHWASGNLGAGLVHYAAATLALAPGIAVLGARRPHHRTWHWVVLSLVVVLWIPRIQWALGAGGEGFWLPGVWQGFWAALLALQWLNYALTRHALATTLALAGQVLWWWPFLGYWGRWFPLELAWAAWWGTCLWAAAVGVAWATACRPSAVSHPSPLPQRLFADFRAWFGDFWARRLAWQFNLAAQRNGWPVRLGWGGFYWVEEPPAPGSQELGPVLECMKQFLRRFVSQSWIQERLSAWGECG